MLKLIKRLFLLCIFIIIGAGIWGYNNGMRQDNYKEFISDIVSKYRQKITYPKAETKSQESKSKTKRKKENEKTVKYKLQPLPRNPFSSIDNHSRNCSSSVTRDILNLATFLQQKATTDIEKARSIYIWITDNIRYDDDAFNSGIYPDYTADYVLQNRKAVCEGYSNLYLALGREMGLAIEKVSGYAKGYGYTNERKFSKTDHAWNVIKVEGKWKIFDSTWGGGHGSNVNGELVSKKDFDDYWFNVDPYESIFNHLPEDNRFSFVQPSLSLSQYEKIPKVDKEYFELGFKGGETYSAVSANPNSEFPQCYKPETHIEIISAPKFKYLTINQYYYFEFYVPRGLKLALIDSNNNWAYFDREKGKFNLNYTPQKSGKLQICLQHEKSGKSYNIFLVYEVRDKKESI